MMVLYYSPIQLHCMLFNVKRTGITYLIIVVYELSMIGFQSLPFFLFGLLGGGGVYEQSLFQSVSVEAGYMLPD
jgi:hypothetical protein